MKRTIFICILFACCCTAKADHITGGEMYYTFVGYSNNLYHYKFTAKFFKDCNINRQLNNTTSIVAYAKGSNAPAITLTVPLNRQEKISLGNPNKCITNPPPVCYDVGFYEFELSLPASPDGYVIACQVNFRINGINNLVAGYGNIGATYTAEIPAVVPLPTAAENNSARFVGSDLVVVCADNSFSYSFEANDADGDELRYSFCNAYRSTGGAGANNTPPPDAPPYFSVPYGQGFSGSAPLGSNVRIDPKTGLITGIAPHEGIYVVTVCVEEIRNGKVIAMQRKDLQIKIAACTIAAASILPEYMLCRDSKDLFLTNRSTSPLISTYNWQVSNSRGETLFSSTDASLSYSFSDTGLYNIKLIINKGGDCSDSATSLARVYPGFIPDFDVNGFCLAKTTSFTDKTTSVYGSVAGWKWDFGDLILTNDVSTDQHPTYRYTAIGNRSAQLIVTNTNGCIDTANKMVSIIDKPPIELAFRDTLICSKDAIQLLASGNGSFSWTPAATITAANTNNPIVAPKTTTTYFVKLDDEGCINDDSVKVRVVDVVSMQAMQDTVICQGDAVQLKTVSNAFSYSWYPAATLNNPTAGSPIATVNATTTYEVTASIGSCTATEEIVVTAVPYPVANAGRDTLICYGTATTLNGSIVGNAFNWSGAASLTGAGTLVPLAKPTATTAYILTAFDNRGCSKPGRDTVLVTVLPDILAFAGRDTAVVAGQPVQLQATGGIDYLWQPGTYLSATDIANPIASFGTASEGLQYKVLVYNEAGCADSAYITIKVFNTGPSVFVPTAFTPNGDGKNDVLKPVAVGMQKIEYFSIYNRWGQQVFSTATHGKGWDGTIKGQPQGSGTFIWNVKAVDFSGKVYFQKGMATLIR